MHEIYFETYQIHCFYLDFPNHKWACCMYWEYTHSPSSDYMSGCPGRVYAALCSSLHQGWARLTSHHLSSGSRADKWCVWSKMVSIWTWNWVWSRLYIYAAAYARPRPSQVWDQPGSYCKCPQCIGVCSVYCVWVSPLLLCKTRAKCARHWDRCSCWVTLPSHAMQWVVPLTRNKHNSAHSLVNQNKGSTWSILKFPREKVFPAFFP